jgi:hypothetical protein
MVKIQQINTLRSRASLDLTLHLVTTSKVDLICITEPSKLQGGMITGTLEYDQVCNNNSVILFSKKLRNTHAVHTSPALVLERSSLQVYIALLTWKSTLSYKR